MAPPPTASAGCKNRSRKKCKPQAAIQVHPPMPSLPRDRLTLALPPPQPPRLILILLRLTASPWNLPLRARQHPPGPPPLLNHLLPPLPQFPQLPQLPHPRRPPRL